MLNTQKLLYLLPDVSYLAELLPAKKPHSFSIQSFRQINGEFMTDEENLLIQNINKLFAKLEPGEYHLILPDFLFTNTIINVAAASDAKIAAHLKEKLLPSLDITTASHQISSTKLTEFKGTAKVQLSAIEKSLISPFKVLAAEHGISITAISPISWTIKSVVSLEPSITVLQIGSKLYTAFHYIGVDQATITEVADVDAVIETIKTLKGTEPSIQTVYLLSNSLVEETLKEKISDTLPVQQLASFKEDDSQMPSYVKAIIEAGMKTISISDYPVPQFKVGKPTDDDQAIYQEMLGDESNSETSTQSSIDADAIDTEESEEETVEALDVHGLPKPKPLSLLDDDTDGDDDEEEEQSAELVDDDIEETSAPTQLNSQEEVDEDSDAIAEDELEEDTESDDQTTDSKNAAVTPTIATIAHKTETTVLQIEDGDTDSSSAVEGTRPTSIRIVDSTEDDSVILSKPNMSNKQSQSTQEDENVDLEQFVAGGETKVSATKQPIKNKTGATSMLKMILITVLVFFLTVAIGVGVGYMVLNWSNSQDTQTETPSPTPVIQPTATPIPTAVPASDSAETTTTTVDPSKLSILIVNATAKAGYAGTTKSKLDTAKVGTTKAANAKGTYDKGMYVLIKDKDQALINFLTKTTGLKLEYSEEQQVEDPSEQYDAVIVLAE